MKVIRFLALTVVVVSLTVSQSVQASQVSLSVEMSNPLLPAQKKQTTFLKVGLTGFKMNKSAARAPVNIAIVLDKSRSMQGSKIEEARRGAIEAVKRLGPNDIVSVITYDSTVQVLVPATKLTDKAAALKCLNENAQYLDKYANELNSRELSAYQAFTVRQALDLNRDGNVYRKRAQSQVGNIEGQRGYDLNPKPKR
jgi:hypothetical protein